MKTKYDVGDALREQGLRTNVNKFECAACGRAASISDPPEIAELVDHCMFDHVGRESIMAVTYTVAADRFQVALEMGLDAATLSEQLWRDKRVEEIDHLKRLLSSNGNV
jgi:hypothetical protein